MKKAPRGHSHKKLSIDNTIYAICRIRPIADFTGGMRMTTILTAASANI